MKIYTRYDFLDFNGNFKFDDFVNTLKKETKAVLNCFDNEVFNFDLDGFFLKGDVGSYYQFLSFLNNRYFLELFYTNISSCNNMLDVDILFKHCCSLNNFNLRSHYPKFIDFFDCLIKTLNDFDIPHTKKIYDVYLKKEIFIAQIRNENASKKIF